MIMRSRSDKIIFLHKLGLNNAKIAELTGCSRENVRQVLVRVNLYSPIALIKNRKDKTVWKSSEK